MRLFIDHIVRTTQTPLRIPLAGADDVTGNFQLPHRGADRVDLLAVDLGQAAQGIIPVLRQRQHLGEQSLRLQRQAAVPQMVVAHDGIIAVAFDPKHRHGIGPPK